MGSRVLVTGGAGYIGSHTCVELLRAGYDLTVVDSLENSRASVIGRVEKIAGKKIGFHRGDVRDREFLTGIFRQREFGAVIHFAGLKAVGESVEQPLRYYDYNVRGTINLLEVMEEVGVRRIVFSSSATVYGDASEPPFKEDAPLGPANPYGRCKLMVEQIVTDLAQSREGWRVVLLRYFNPVGAHESGTIGEEPSGIPNNLMPYIARVAAGTLERLSVFGNDYPTADGTGVRDYIHVVDLAAGHVAALNALDRLPRVSVLNLGTGRGHSVLEVLEQFERACGHKLPFRIAPRREGDVAVSFADASLAHALLGWRAERDLQSMCRDAWRWQQWSMEHGGDR